MMKLDIFEMLIAGRSSDWPASCLEHLAKYTYWWLLLFCPHLPTPSWYYGTNPTVWRAARARCCSKRVCREVRTASPRSSVDLRSLGPFDRCGTEWTRGELLGLLWQRHTFHFKVTVLSDCVQLSYHMRTGKAPCLQLWSLGNSSR